MQRSSSQNTKIDFDEGSGRFRITCPVWDNGRVRALPNRRWYKARSCWVAPAIRANVEALRNLFKSADWTPAARAKLDGFDLERVKAKRLSHWPSFYRFKREPRPKQLEALQKTYGLKAIALFMDPRTGKTKVITDMGSALRVEGVIQNMMVLCPVNCKRNWKREIAVDATIPWDIHILEAGGGKKFEQWMRSPHDFKCLIVGIESLSAENSSAVKCAQKYLECMPKVMLAVDESDMIKSHNATRSERIVQLGKSAVIRLIATGTPLTKNPMDLYMQYEFLDPNIIGLGDYYSFKARYAVMGGYEQKEIIGYDNLDELIELVSPFTFQVRQNEVLHHTRESLLVEVELTAEQRALYADMKKYSAISTGDQAMIVQNVLEKMLRLQEIVGGFVSYQYTEQQLDELRARMGPKAKLPRTYRVPIPGRNPKIEAVMQCVEKYPGPTIIWCAFKDEIFAVRDALAAKYGQDQVVELHGDVEDAQRDHGIEQLFKKGKARFVVGNEATGGVGLTMSIAQVMIYYSGTHVFRNRAQSEERATADNKSTLIIDLIANKTTDEVIVASNLQKKDVAEFIRGEIDAYRKRGKGMPTLDQIVEDAAALVDKCPQNGN